MLRLAKKIKLIFEPSFLIFHDKIHSPISTCKYHQVELEMRCPWRFPFDSDPVYSSGLFQHCFSSFGSSCTSGNFLKVSIALPCKKTRQINPIPLDIFRFRVKTMPQTEGKWQGVQNIHPLEENRVMVCVLV